MEFAQAYREYEEIKVEIQVRCDKKIEKQNDLLKKRLVFQTLCDSLKKEKKDVEQLEQVSLAQILAKMFGTLEAKHEKEYGEYIQAKRQYDEACYRIETLEEEIARTDREVEAMKKQLSQKEAFLLANFEEAKELNQQINKKREEYIRMEKEYVEAITAVERTLRIAKDMKNSLGSAKSCATFDTFFGGGLLTDMAKYSEIERAQSLQNELMQAIESMKKELLDVDIRFQGASVEIDGTTKVFDVLFDNIFTDWNVRKQIEENHDKMEEYVAKLQNILSDLHQKKDRQEEAIRSCNF
ncbi:MAG: hypothetical protein ACERKN_15760 [Velocimicrobium sp.]